MKQENAVKQKNAIIITQICVLLKKKNPNGLDFLWKPEMQTTSLSGYIIETNPITKRHSFLFFPIHKRKQHPHI